VGIERYIRGDADSGVPEVGRGLWSPRTIVNCRLDPFHPLRMNAGHSGSEKAVQRLYQGWVEGHDSTALSDCRSGKVGTPGQGEIKGSRVAPLPCRLILRSLRILSFRKCGFFCQPETHPRTRGIRRIAPTPEPIISTTKSPAFMLFSESSGVRYVPLLDSNP